MCLLLFFLRARLLWLFGCALLATHQGLLLYHTPLCLALPAAQQAGELLARSVFEEICSECLHELFHCHFILPASAAAT